MGNRSRGTLPTPDIGHWPTCRTSKATGKGHKLRSRADANQKNPSPWISLSPFMVETQRLTATCAQTGWRTSTVWKAYSAADTWTGCFFCLLWSFHIAQQTHGARPNTFQIYKYGATQICLTPRRTPSVTPRCGSSTSFVPPPATRREQMEKRADAGGGLLTVRGWRVRGGEFSSTCWNISLLSLSVEHFTIDLAE